MWQRASPGVDVTESPPGEAAGQVLTGQRTREALDDLAWTASLPDDSHVQPDGTFSGEESGPVLLRINRQVVSVRPSWITVVQDHASGAARLYASRKLLSSSDVSGVGVALEPFCTVDNAPFLRDDMPTTDLLRYYVGFVGDVGPTEEDILWPNQVLHRDRILFNVRSGADIATFLSSPTLEDVLAHSDNLRRIALERRYQLGWCWQMLKLRWGGAVLSDLKLQKSDFV